MKKHYRGVDYIIVTTVSGKVYLSARKGNRFPSRTVFESEKDAEEYLRLWADGLAKAQPV